MENGKYKRDGIMWMERKTSLPLTGLVYDFAENGKKWGEYILHRKEKSGQFTMF